MSTIQPKCTLANSEHDPTEVHIGKQGSQDESDEKELNSRAERRHEDLLAEAKSQENARGRKREHQQRRQREIHGREGYETHDFLTSSSCPSLSLVRRSATRRSCSGS
jgi:hypothetical protein